MPKKLATPVRFTPEERADRQARFARRGQKRYDRLWQQMADAFGASDHESPVVRLNAPSAPGGYDAYVDMSDRLRRVNLGSSRTRKLAKLGQPKLSDRQKRTWTQPRKRWVKRRKTADKRAVKRAILHEWAHVYQDRPAFGEIDPHDYPKLQEGAAELFAVRTAKKRFGRTEGVYRPERRAVRKLYDRDFILRGQFGSRYGTDPRAPR